MEMGQSAKITVLNPQGYPPKISGLGMAPRPNTLDGKTVYLVDTRFDDGDRLLHQMEAWFHEQMPQVNVIFVSKSGVYTQPDPKLYAEIRDKGAAAIVAVGH
jgi:hypothetical protein